MKFTYKQELPTPEEIISALPLKDSLKKIKDQKLEEIKQIFTGESDKFLLLIGPCSADNEKAVLEYIGRLAKAQEKVKDKILIVPRIYTNKPRTTGEGYKGMVHQPNPEEDTDMQKGIIAIRSMHIKTIENFHMPAADEMLYPENYAYLADILAYVAIGARSVENQQHRLTSSGVNAPVGMKNPTSGDIAVMLNSIRAAQLPQRFIFRGYEVETTGNELAHGILRGAVDIHGVNIPNYHYEDLVYVYEEYMKRNLKNPALIIDCNHSNSGKKFAEQPRISMEIMHSRRYNPELKKMIKGLMIESYLEEGSQKIGENIYGKSITDPCLGWSATERLIYDIAEKMN
ncbi:MAG: 3-deoxy-7-phosphoheptulonate synthase [Clostridia bacterium]|nr:3-deoxy-7-phosphoheptulonate synthase [Clostridia bacterium]